MATLANTRSSPVRPGQIPGLQLRRILCPLEFSDLSTLAMDKATQLAAVGGAEITALFVFPIDRGAAAGAGREALDPGARTTVAKDAEWFLQLARAAGVKVNFMLAAGDPAAEIVAAAATTDADLIVMGTHARTGLERWVLGSVTQAVLRNAPCPVLTVAAARRDEHAAVARDGGGILCALELDDASSRTLAHAAALGRATGQRVTLLHVLEDLSPYQAAALCARVDWSALCRDLEQEARERLRAVASAAGSDVVTDVMVTTGKPYREILRLADERDAAMIVMGTHGRPSRHLRLFGSNAEHVVCEAGCPVLTVRA